MSPELSDEASSNFLPGDFGTEKDSIKLVPGATLGNEQLIFSSGVYEAKDGVVDNGLAKLRSLGNAMGLGPKGKE